MSAILLNAVRHILVQTKRVSTRRSGSLPSLAGRAFRVQRFFERISYGWAQDRIHRAAIERELYQGRYRHSSKCDDDLPIVR